MTVVHTCPASELTARSHCQAQAKFDLSAAVTALRWIESVNGRQLGDRDVGSLKTERDVAELLKDGTALCE